MMTTPELLERYRWALSSLQGLRAKAGYQVSELEDGTALRAEAHRFAKALANAPDEATAEMELLADHAGAQAFWALLQNRWEQMEVLLMPSAFELMPNPLPYEVLTIGFLAMLDTESAPAAGLEGVQGARTEESFVEGAAQDAAPALSPRVGKDGKAGAVWEFTDVY